MTINHSYITVLVMKHVYTTFLSTLFSKLKPLLDFKRVSVFLIFFACVISSAYMSSNRLSH